MTAPLSYYVACFGSLNCNKRKGETAPHKAVLLLAVIEEVRHGHITNGFVPLNDQMEYQLNDRISFRNFVGLYSGDKVPDAKTIWLYNNNLSKTGAAKVLFDQFSAHLQDRGFYLNAGQMVDASFVEVPKQRNTREENKKIKEGEGDDLWKETPNKNSQKDKDARWTKKGGQNHYGYKDHTKVDVGSKLIKSYVVTDAAVHGTIDRNRHFIGMRNLVYNMMRLGQLVKHA